MTKTVLVCGSRIFNNWELLYDTLDAIEITHIVSGGAPGADTEACRYAKDRSIARSVYPALWSKYGKRAGYIRNVQMLEIGKPDLVVAFFDDSPCVGTHMMCRLAEDAGVEVRRITVGG